LHQPARTSARGWGRGVESAAAQGTGLLLLLLLLLVLLVLVLLVLLVQ
jgi:hypothetical protein